MLRVKRLGITEPARFRLILTPQLCALGGCCPTPTPMKDVHAFPRTQHFIFNSKCVLSYWFISALNINVRVSWPAYFKSILSKKKLSNETWINTGSKFYNFFITFITITRVSWPAYFKSILSKKKLSNETWINTGSRFYNFWMKKKKQILLFQLHNENGN